MTDSKIVTSHIRPPIPTRMYDWIARYDGDEESGPRGYGSTEEAAVSQLMEETIWYDLKNKSVYTNH